MLLLLPLSLLLLLLVQSSLLLLLSHQLLLPEQPLMGERLWCVVGRSWGKLRWGRRA